MTHAGITRRRRSIAADAAVLTAGVLFPIADVPSAGADSCPDAEVVFARGTDDPATYDFLGAIDAANDASGHIQHMVNDCPNTKLVLGGYSQGAAARQHHSRPQGSESRGILSNA